MKVIFSKQFLAFLVTGGIAAATNFTSRIFYSTWLDYSTSIILAYLTGMITAFLLAKLYVFSDSRHSLHTSVAYFCLVNLLAVIQVWLISMVLAHYLLPALGVRSHIEEIAHAAGVIFPVFTSFLGHKYWSFRQ